MDKNNSDSFLAVLIDADNARADMIEGLLEEVAKYGAASVKRAYGDWTGPRLQKWKKVLHEHSIQPVQQFAYTEGKNATDSALIIDAMDLLYTKNFGAFCLVSSDSDFTRLASRIREAGVEVYGFGERKTPFAFRKACDKFTYIEVFCPGDGDTVISPSSEKLASDPIAKALCSAVAACSGDDDWALLGSVANHINKTVNDFDSRNYGCPKFIRLIEKIGLFDLKWDGSSCSIREKKTQTKGGGKKHK